MVTFQDSQSDSGCDYSELSLDGEIGLFTNSPLFLGNVENHCLFLRSHVC